MEEKKYLKVVFVGGPMYDYPYSKIPDLYGFVFPGRYSGLFGHFFELLTMAEGVLFNDNLKPKFVNETGEWALGLLRSLYKE